jgi:AcrR family transcriptional regulator
MTDGTLRERQAALARDSICAALIRHLEAGDVDDVSIEDLAQEAGLSRRTVYRYFPGRSDLIGAAGQWLHTRVLELPVGIGAEGIAASFRTAASRLRRRPRLARALLGTDTGRAIRATYRAARVNAIREALARERPGLPAQEASRAAAVLSYLCSSNAWLTIRDESQLDADEAVAAVEWAIETLLHALPHRTSTARKGRR